MKIKIIFTIIAVAFFAISNMQSQEKVTTEQSPELMETNKEIYTCSMHPEVESDNPGECPKCGMKLVKIEKQKDLLKTNSDKMNMMHKKMAKTYVCSMHPEVKSDKTGTCIKCGMHLVEKKMIKEKKKDNKGHNGKKHNH